MKTGFRYIMFCICVLFGWILFTCGATYTEEEINKMFEPITDRYGIKIKYKLDKTFPPMLLDGKRKKPDKLEPIEHSVLRHYPRILKNALEKYPDRVIQEYLDGICFAEKMEHNGISFAGTYGYFDWSVYLFNNGRKTDKHVEKTFHHEFSSILLKHKGFFLNPWHKQNPKDFKYLYTIHENKEDVKINPNSSKTDYEDGFIANYGRTSFENDFNEYSGIIFTYPEKFKKIMDQYPRVRAKFLVWLKFYRKIDPIFTEEYFFGADRYTQISP